MAALRRHPKLWKYVVAPALITALLLVGLVIGVLELVHPISHWVHGHLPARLADAAGTTITAVIGVVLWIAVPILFVPLAGVVAGPFAEKLSERLEAALTGQPAADTTFGDFLHGLVLAVAHGLRRLIAALFGLLVVFIIGWAPVIGAIAGVVVAAWIAAHSAAYDSYDAVLGRRLLPYGAKLAYLKQHRARTMGLGAAVAGMLLVPGLNLVALGLGAAGATVASLELERRAALPTAYVRP
ncbi:MAG TPA: EI24 domain-containing protein [Kofleriaceae bacterium]|nr:EI24 domain-containing protein [Kofleriaceae bacterium]